MELREIVIDALANNGHQQGVTILADSSDKYMAHALLSIARLELRRLDKSYTRADILALQHIEKLERELF